MIYDTKDFIRMVAQKAHFAQKDVADILEAMTDVFQSAAQSGDTIKIRGFGILSVHVIKPRDGYNKKTGQMEPLPEAQRVNFKLSQKIRHPTVTQTDEEENETIT